MKAKSILCALLLIVAGWQTASAQKAMKVYRGSNFDVYYVNNVDSVSFVEMVSEIQLSETSIELEKGETFQLTATVLPAQANDKNVTWESTNTYAATVDENGLVTARQRGWTYIICYAADGSEVKAQCYVKVNAEIVPGTHEYVDLDLPSGTLWATCNVGADAADEPGLFYAWGETEPKDDYTWATYKYMTPGYERWEYVNKYTFADTQTSGIWYDENGNFIGDGLKELLPEDDAATVNWGAEWQTPSIEQFEELFDDDNCEYEEITNGEMHGWLITSKINGNSIFFPCAGYYDGTALLNYNYLMQYWTRNTHIDSDYGGYFSFNTLDTSSRYRGRPIRPVRKP